MPKSRNDYIREELSKDFDAPAAAIVERVTKKGHRCAAQHVYQLRSTLRHSQGRIREQQAATLAAARQTQNQSKPKRDISIVSQIAEGLTPAALTLEICRLAKMVGGLKALGRTVESLQQALEGMQS
jgi:hypothetical protein